MLDNTSDPSDAQLSGIEPQHIVCKACGKEPALADLDSGLGIGCKQKIDNIDRRASDRRGIRKDMEDAGIPVGRWERAGRRGAR